MLRAQAGSRRRESPNPERQQTGKREEVENIYSVLKYSKEGREVQESAVPLKGFSHSLPHVVTLIVGLGTTYLFYCIRSGNHRFPRFSEDATP